MSMKGVSFLSTTGSTGHKVATSIKEHCLHGRRKIDGKRIHTFQIPVHRKLVRKCTFSTKFMFSRKRQNVVLIGNRFQSALVWWTTECI